MDAFSIQVCRFYQSKGAFILKLVSSMIQNKHKKQISFFLIKF